MIHVGNFTGVKNCWIGEYDTIASTVKHVGHISDIFSVKGRKIKFCETCVGEHVTHVGNFFSVKFRGISKVTKTCSIVKHVTHVGNIFSIEF